MDGTPPDKNLQVAIAVSVAELAIGGLGWLWTGEWRWAVSAVVVAVVTLVAGAVIGSVIVKPPGE